MPDPVLSVRHTEPGDFEAIHRVFTHPGAVWGTAQLPYPSAESWRKRLAEPPPGLYSLVVCAGEEVVGQLGLHTAPNSPRRRHAGRLGMAVRDDWHGKGAGSALMQAAVNLADRWLNLIRLELEVYTDNMPAIRLYEKFGFVKEGVHKQYVFRDGVFVDAYAMARLRSTSMDLRHSNSTVE
jgi:putative acetyltransferase